MSIKTAVIIPSSSFWWKLGAISGASAVLFGAFGAHALKAHVKDEKMLKNWETAAHYHLLHSVALLAAPLAKRPALAGGLLATGTLLFSGSLYAMVLTDQRKLGAITREWVVTLQSQPCDPKRISFPRPLAPASLTIGFFSTRPHTKAKKRHQYQTEQLKGEDNTMRKWCLWAMAMALLVAPVFGACPNKCSGHGRCGINDVCDCMQNWVGGDCSMRLCPYVRAWQDTAVDNNDAHYYKECGNRGTCDREKGVCDCDAGFTGSGCRRMVCPDDCSGHGVCDFIEELAQNSFDKRIGGVQGRTYTLWDQEKIMGCKCDPGYEGHSCAKRTCPKGDDQLTPNQYEMVQAIYITGGVVTGYLTYFDPYGNAFTTGEILFDGTSDATTTTTCAAVQTALQRLPNNALNKVTVSAVAAAASVTSFARDKPTAISSTGAASTVFTRTSPETLCLVKFRSEPGETGYQHLLGCNVQPHSTAGMQPNTLGLLAAVCTVAEIQEANTGVTGSLPLSELGECSNRGLCDYTSGTCKCFTGHMGLACERQEALV